MTPPPYGRAPRHRLPIAGKVFLAVFPVVVVAGLVVQHLWNAGTFSAPETKSIPDPCLVLNAQVQQIIGGPPVTGLPTTSDIGGIQTRRCVWSQSASPSGSLSVEYDLHRRADGMSGINSARIGMDADVRVDGSFPSPTSSTTIAHLGDEAHLLIGRFGDTAGELTQTTVVVRRANVVIEVQGTGSPGPAADRLTQLVATALAGIATP
ncbi:hypothetical protein [Actinomadura rupiterrae]|uniref:hypothetical protein n=1 Tax=Actinomadura rupiterrae TaxID=559627 RepID=UPI0020A474E4|nr:hypothetical protein [Actinomadura rupiterrae]MCP2342246.1 hypothetical protein [Actinomadura rupiterrae]